MDNSHKLNCTTTAAVVQQWCNYKSIAPQVVQKPQFGEHWVLLYSTIVVMIKKYDIYNENKKFVN